MGIYCTSCGGRTDGYLEVGARTCACLEDVNWDGEADAVNTPSSLLRTAWVLTDEDRAILRVNKIKPEDSDK